MHLFRFAPVLALLCAVALAPAGCGGSDSPTITVTPTPSASPAASRSVFAGEYRGTWQVETEPDDKVYGRTTISGPANISVAGDGTFTAVLENTTAFTYGVFTEKNKTHTLRGTMGDSGYFNATVTVSETVGNDVVETTDRVTGVMVKPLAGGDNRYRGTITLTHMQVAIYGTLDLAGGN